MQGNPSVQGWHLSGITLQNLLVQPLLVAVRDVSHSWVVSACFRQALLCSALGGTELGDAVRCTPGAELLLQLKAAELPLEPAA